MIQRAPLILLALFLLSCNGGGDGGSSSSSGGIGGSGITSLSQGPVTAVGSRVVTGTRWDLDSAAIRSDGMSGFTEADLELGIVATVEGERSADGLTGVASSVSFDIRIRGPIDAGSVVDLGAGSVEFSVFDVVIFADATTFFEPGTLLLDDDLVVEVSGLPGPGGSVTATRIEQRAPAPIFGTTEIEAKGFVRNFAGMVFDLDLDGDSGDTELSVNLSTLPCGATTLDPFDLDLDDEPFVEVRGILTAARTMCARDVELEDDGLEGDQDDVEIEGVVTDFVSLASFRVGGVLVNASAAEYFPATLAMSLGDGVRVEVEGELQAGVLLAEEVKQRDGEVRISAAVEQLGDVDPFGGTVTLLGILVETDADTGFEGITDLSDVQTNDYLEVRAVLDPLGAVVATEIKDEGPEPGEKVALRGPVEAIDLGSPRQLTILGVQFVAEEPGTEFSGFDEEPITADRFYERVRVGDVIEAEDETGLQTVLDQADEVEFED